jgi:hypothetical protein
VVYSFSRIRVRLIVFLIYLSFPANLHGAASFVVFRPSMTHILGPIAPVTLRRLPAGPRQCHAVTRAPVPLCASSSRGSNAGRCMRPLRQCSTRALASCHQQLRLRTSAPPLQAGRALAMPFFPHEWQQQSAMTIDLAYESVQAQRYKMKYLRVCHRH